VRKREWNFPLARTEAAEIAAHIGSARVARKRRHMQIPAGLSAGRDQQKG
jgi:hypothetical protein